MKKIVIRLLTDTTFGRGDGVPGLVDDEIDHEADTGLPLIKGRTLKGLLVEECANLMYAIEQWSLTPQKLADMQAAACRLFGRPGSTASDEGSLHIGEARFPQSVAAAVRQMIQQNPGDLSPQEVLHVLTGVRRRSAIDPVTEAPLDETLRSARVLLRETELHAALIPLEDLPDLDWQLLAACIKALRRGGKNRNRGAGHLSCRLWSDDQDVTDKCVADFFTQLKN